MSFPESKRIVFAENPLVEVICQLSFPSILAIAAEAPVAFQEAIRAEYPQYSRVDGIGNYPPEIANIIAALPVPVPLDSVTHRFASADGTTTVSLGREFVAVATNSYTEWHGLRREIERAKAALEEIYRPAFYTRVGLRYRDVIDRTRLGLTDVAWPELLTPAILGPLGADESVRSGVDVARGEARVALAEPPGAFVNLSHGLVEQSGGHQYLVDADWYSNERSDAGDVLQLLDAFNRQAGDLFRWTISDRLRDALGSRDG